MLNKTPNYYRLISMLINKDINVQVLKKYILNISVAKIIFVNMYIIVSLLSAN